MTLHTKPDAVVDEFHKPEFKDSNLTSTIPFHVCRTPSILIAEDFSKFWAEACWSVSQPGM